jgi:hypothetical protein
MSQPAVNLLQATRRDRTCMTSAWLSRLPSIGEFLKYGDDTTLWRTRSVSGLPIAYGNAHAMSPVACYFSPVALPLPSFCSRSMALAPLPVSAIFYFLPSATSVRGWRGRRPCP